VRIWNDGGCRGDLAKAVDRGFDALKATCADWALPGPGTTPA
jgi:hypothetical protein